MSRYVVLLAAAAAAVGWMATPPQATAAPERYQVLSDNHPLTVWARLPRAPKAVVLLVHGRTWSSLPDWDLQVPGLERSVLRSLAAQGIGAYAVDLRGYGGTPRDATGFNTPRRSAEDVLNVLAWVKRRHPGLRAPTLAGWSRGAAISMMAAQLSPTAMSSLVLFGFSWDPAAEFPDIEDGDGPPARSPNTPEAAAADFISPAVTPRVVITAFVRQALRSDPILVDLRGDGEYAMLAASKVAVPTLVVYGDRDPAILEDALRRFVAALATQTKRVVALPGADHAAQLEDTHRRWVDAVAGFALESR